MKQLLAILVWVVVLLWGSSSNRVSGSWFFTVENKFAGKSKSLDALKIHDTRRMLTGVDIPLGGTGRPDGAGNMLLHLIKNDEMRTQKKKKLFIVMKYLYLMNIQSWDDETTYGDEKAMLEKLEDVGHPLKYDRKEQLDGRVNIYVFLYGVRLYYAEIGIGTPSKAYYVQVDTGSDIMWVNCIECKGCPKKSSLNIELTLYNVNDSLTGNVVSCDQDFCSEISDGTVAGCTGNMPCTYSENYGDGSSTAGYFVKDVVQYDRVSGNLQTTLTNESIIFGCGAIQSGGLGSSDEALDGILGFGESNSSVISQLASAGEVKKIFAHCLNGITGGGIFAVGQVVQPKVNATPLIPNQPHYSVNLTAVEVGHEFLNLTTDEFGWGGKIRTIIDSGTTLAYLPELIYEPLVQKIISNHSNLKVQIVDGQYTCFQYSESLDDGFPNITFVFENSVTLKVYPHEYLFPFDDLWCIGWQNSALQSQERKDLTLLGDLALSNKLVVYDLENQVIGWTEYNCKYHVVF
ncbi:Xylanase inhibitor, C-terminal [Dillenia turbinata]|uniref:Xylanase inhibitor, C-terminal n=1 Tax=Dillenia turbinata TaxID=194707 RepID=A0AAN8UKD5_9MAGN